MTAADFEHMSIGMIFGYIIRYGEAIRAAEDEENGVREATDEDYIAF